MKRDRAAPTETKRKETISKGVDTHRRSPKKALTDVRWRGRADPNLARENLLERILQRFRRNSPTELSSSASHGKAESSPRIDVDPMTFATRGHRLNFVLEGLPFSREGQARRREYRDDGEGS